MKPSNFTGALLASILVFTLIGYNMDSYFGTTPLFICVGIAYAIIGCFYLLLRKLREQDAKKD